LNQEQEVGYLSFPRWPPPVLCKHGSLLLKSDYVLVFEKCKMSFNFRILIIYRQIIFGLHQHIVLDDLSFALDL
jgi:hypothetical protein